MSRRGSGGRRKWGGRGEPGRGVEYVVGCRESGEVLCLLAESFGFFGCPVVVVLVVVFVGVCALVGVVCAARFAPALFFIIFFVIFFVFF